MRQFNLKSFILGNGYDRRARVARAFRYAIGRSTLSDSYDIARDCREINGLYPLVELSADDVWQMAVDRWGEHPELERLSKEAARRVFNKWSSTGHELDGAQDWAMDLVAEYAEADGIEMVDSWDLSASNETETEPV